MKRLFTLLWLVCLLVPAVASAQGQAAVRLDVVVGIGGTTKMETWTPINITVANTGNDLQGEVEWEWDSGGTFAQVLDLPRGANKQVLLPVRNTNFSRSATVRFVVDGAVQAQRTVPVEPLDQGQIVIAVHSDDSLTFNDFVVLNDNQIRRLIQLTSADLPERPELLAAVNVLVMAGDTTALQPTQLAALRQWVVNGGRLVINGNGRQVGNGLSDLLPATVGEGGRTLPINDVVGGRAPQPQDVVVLPLTPKPGTLPQTSQNGTVWLVQQRLGRGLVAQTAFDLRQVRQAGLNAEAIWRNNLSVSFDQQPFFGGPTDFLRQALTLPALRLPSLATLLGFLVMYIVLVGPVNYLILRRLDRREWAYLTVPLTVLVFTGGAYLFGTSGRGGNALVNELTVVQTTSGETRGLATTEIGLFSPTRRAYRVTLPSDALVSDQSGLRRVGSGSRSVRTETGVDLPQVLVDVGALQSFMVEQTVAVPQIEATREGGPNGTIVVRNLSDQTLEDVVLMQGQQVRTLKDLAPGAEVRVGMPDANAYDELGLRQPITVDRQQVIRRYVDRFGFAQFARPNLEGPPPIPNAEGVIETIPVPIQPVPFEPGVQTLSVFAWQPTSLVPVQLNGAEVAVQGETLIIVGVADAVNR